MEQKTEQELLSEARQHVLEIEAAKTLGEKQRLFKLNRLVDRKTYKMIAIKQYIRHPAGLLQHMARTDPKTVSKLKRKIRNQEGF